MAKTVAFLRGMNVGGHRITNADLTTHFVAMGFDDVSTYRASGNVLFDDGGLDSAAVVARIESSLLKGLGYEVPTLVRTAAQVAAIEALRPFTAQELAASTGKVQVTLYRQAPSRSQAAEVLSHASEDDRLAVNGCELYWLPKGRMTDSLMDVKAIDRILGVGTTRTLGTLSAIAKRVG